MKEIKLEGKLNLNKAVISKLNDDNLKTIKGGGFTSIGKKCITKNGCLPVTAPSGCTCQETTTVSLSCVPTITE